MKQFVILLVVLAVAAFAAYWPARHHVVKTDKGVVVLAKRFLTYTDTFVDVRNWSSADFDAHPDLKRALMDQGYRDVLADVKTKELKATFSNLVERAVMLADETAEKIAEAVAQWLGEAPGTNWPFLSSNTTQSGAAPTP